MERSSSRFALTPTHVWAGPIENTATGSYTLPYNTGNDNTADGFGALLPHSYASHSRSNLRQSSQFPQLVPPCSLGRYYACKKLYGICRERSLDTCDCNTGKWRMKEWIGSLDHVDAQMVSPIGDI